MPSISGRRRRTTSTSASRSPASESAVESGKSVTTSSYREKLRRSAHGLSSTRAESFKPSGPEVRDPLDDPTLLAVREAEEEREADEPVADALRDRTVPAPVTEPMAHWRVVKREIVEHAEDL